MNSCCNKLHYKSLKENYQIQPSDTIKTLHGNFKVFKFYLFCNIIFLLYFIFWITMRTSRCYFWIGEVFAFVAATTALEPRLLGHLARYAFEANCSMIFFIFRGIVDEVILVGIFYFWKQTSTGLDCYFFGVSNRPNCWFL